jgi:hypothetical protein
MHKNCQVRTKILTRICVEKPENYYKFSSTGLHKPSTLHHGTYKWIDTTIRLATFQSIRQPATVVGSPAFRSCPFLSLTLLELDNIAVVICCGSTSVPSNFFNFSPHWDVQIRCFFHYFEYRSSVKSHLRFQFAWQQFWVERKEWSNESAPLLCWSIQSFNCMTRQPNNDQSAAVKQVIREWNIQARIVATECPIIRASSRASEQKNWGEHQSEQIAKYPRDQILKQTGIQAISVIEVIIQAISVIEVIGIEATKVAKRASKWPSTQVLSKRPSIEASEHSSEQRRRSEQHQRKKVWKRAWKRPSIQVSKCASIRAISIIEASSVEASKSIDVSIEATKYPTPPGNTSIAFCHPKSWVSSSCSYYSIRLAIRAKQLLAITTSQLV